MEVETEAEPPPPPPADLTAVLEHAALMAKLLPSAADPSQLLQIHSALHAAHHRLSLFLSHLPPQPENSVSSAAGDGEPMQMEDDEGEEQNSRAAASAVEKVAWRMRDCFIQNKRRKRPLSPSAEQRQSFDDVVERDGASAAAEEFDPLRTKLRSLDLVYQFRA